MTAFWLGIGWLAIATAIGIGPAWAFGRSAGPRLVLAPILGLSISSGVTTTAALVMSQRQAAFWLLVPIAVVSVGAAVVLAVRERPKPDLVENLLPAGISVGALLVGVAPAIAKSSLGPFTWVLRDAWWYVQSAYWLSGHSLGDRPAPGAFVTDLVGSNAWAALDAGGARLGVIAHLAAGSAILDRPPDQTQFALVASTYALLPAAVWIAARMIGGSRVAATVGALAAVPLGLSLVIDSALSNLAALAVVPVLLACVVRMARTGEWGPAVVAGLLAAGLVSSYPELVPFTVVSLLLAGVVGLAWVLRNARAELGARVRRTALRLGAGLGVAVAVAPYSWWWLYDYLTLVKNSAPGFVDRGLAPDNIGSWVFGLRHIYELEFNRPVPYGGFGSVLAVLLPIALLLVIVAGVWVKDTSGRLAVVAAPMVVSVVLGLYAFETGAVGSTCQYCLWKGLAFSLPFVALGIGLGADGLRALWAQPAIGRRVLAGAGAAAVVLGVTGMALQAKRLNGDVDTAGVYVPSQVRDAVAGARSQLRDQGVFLEGVEDVGDAVALIPGTYHVIKDVPGTRPYLDLEWAQTLAFPLTLHLAIRGLVAPQADYVNPAYRMVLTAFSGLDQGRQRISSAGRYAVERRRPIDVIVARTNRVEGSPDTRAAEAAQPLVDRPFELWVSSPRATPVRLMLRTTPPLASAPAVSVGTTPLDVVRDTAGNMCVDVDAVPGFTRVHVDPGATAEASSRLARAVAEPGRCAPTTREWPPPAAFVSGAYPFEPDWFGGRGARWLRGDAVLQVGARGRPRPATMVELPLQGFVRTRTVTATVDGRVVGRVQARAVLGRLDTLRFRLPSGTGTVRVRLVTRPGEESATIVNKVDDRRLAVLAAVPKIVLLER